MTRPLQQRRDTRVRTLTPIDVSLVLGVLLAGFVAFADQFRNSSLANMAVVAVFVCSICVYAVSRTSERSAWSFPTVSVVVLLIFHLGALPEFLYTETSSLPYVERFIHRQESAAAIWLSLICAIAYALGCVLAAGNPSKGIARSESSERIRPRIADIGGVIAGLSALVWLLFAWRSGLGLGSTYQDYLQAARGNPLQLTYYALGLGISLAAVDLRRNLARLGAMGFALFVLVAFPLGLRGEVLFPCAVVAAVVATQRSMPRLRVAIPVALLLLSTIAVVSQTRQGETSGVNVSPISGLSEMGSSLQVVSGAISWHTSGNEPFAGGKSFIAPISDAFARYVLRQSVIPERQNSDYMSTQVAERIGNVGGSIVGEAYHNFSSLGAVAILFGWGYLLGTLNRLATRHVLWLTAAIVLTFAFQLLVRNSFASTPTILILAGLSVLAAKLLDTVSPHRKSIHTDITSQ